MLKADTPHNTSSLKNYSDSLFKAMESFSDALAVIDVVAENEESLHGAFCRSLSALLHKTYEDIETLQVTMRGGVQ